jgi:hypothetical protein
MPGSPTAIRLIAQEARALLTRLERVKPYALNMPMVPAATLPPQAQSAIEQHMIRGRQALEAMVHKFVAQLEHPGSDLVPEATQKKFAVLRLRFNAVLTQFDIFGDVMAQRSEHGTGVWVSGLDTVAADALSLVMPFAELPPVVCYLDRGIGAAIRRARTRLPGGGENPVGIIRIPRERMIGSGIASSLVHEAGHQGAALIDLVTSLRQVLIERQNRQPLQPAWRLWDRWISEIVADLWSIGLLGLTATLGLFAVVSLPRAFVFRIAEEDPHPFPWFRVKLSCAIGNALYPDRQWLRLAQVWEELYPRTRLDARRLAIIRELEGTMPEFIETMLLHRPEKLEGKRVVDLFPLSRRTPARLRELLEVARQDPLFLQKVPPTLAFAILGQGKAEDVITPEQESESLAALLTHWAVRSSLDTSMICSSSWVPVAQAARLVS